MPHHPSEEVAPDNLTDKIAQHSKDSMASDHPLHDENKGSIAQGSSEDAQKALSSTPGPQIPEKNDLPAAKGKEELQAQAKSLNE